MIVDSEKTLVRISIETKCSPESSSHVEEFDVDDDWPLPEALASLVHTCAMGVLTGREQEDMDAFHKALQDILDRVEMLKEKK